MAGRCFVPGCNSGLHSSRRQDKKENKKHPKIFSAPRVWTMLQIWSHVIPTTDRKFSITDKICELHFPEDYVVKFHELTLDSGKIYKLERKFAKLKPGAIPTIFPNLPQYSDRVKEIIDKMRVEFPLHISEMAIKIDERMESYFKKILNIRKLFASNPETEVEAKKENSNENININSENSDAEEMDFCTDMLSTENDESTDRNMSDDDFSMCDEDISNTNNKTIMPEYEDIESEEDEESEPDEITFDVLVRNLKSVSRPNSSWSVTSHGKFVMCAKWNKEYKPEKRIIIDHDLNIKVFLNDNEIAAYNNLCISDVSDISNILRILDK